MKRVWTVGCAILLTACTSKFVEHTRANLGYLEPSFYDAKAREHGHTIYHGFRNQDFKTESVKVLNYDGRAVYKKTVRVIMTRSDPYSPVIRPSKQHTTTITVDLSRAGRLLRFGVERYEGAEGQVDDCIDMMSLNKD